MHSPSLLPYRVSPERTPRHPYTGSRARCALMIATDGTVLTATVERSSGSFMLDRAAIEWVRKHWRYHAGIANGAPVAMTMEAGIRFDIRNAR